MITVHFTKVSTIYRDDDDEFYDGDYTYEEYYIHNHEVSCETFNDFNEVFTRISKQFKKVDIGSNEGYIVNKLKDGSYEFRLYDDFVE